MADSIGHIVEYTRMCAHDQNYLSPFAIEARKYGYRATTGGKVDDITVLVGIVGRENLIY